ncbi:hypothetical protein ACK8P5_23210 [Paenibacillus sp. EC2-1]|uniref:hypothetical protein n=1 Tax=Paenibacillus sp. EC2-1 TaxID=3388665 RepID=UPI003BEF402F
MPNSWFVALVRPLRGRIVRPLRGRIVLPIAVVFGFPEWICTRGKSEDKGDHWRFSSTIPSSPLLAEGGVRH